MDQTSKTLLKRLWKDYIATHKASLIKAGICMVIIAVTTAANAWLLEPVMDKVFVEQNEAWLLGVCVAAVVLAVVKGVSLYFQEVLMQNVGFTMGATVQKDLYEKLLHADMRFLRGAASSSWVSRLTNDINLIRAQFSTLMVTSVRELLTLIALVGLMFYQDAYLATIAFIVFPLAIYPIIRLGKRMRKLSRTTQEEAQNYNRHLDDTLRSVHVVRNNRAEERELVVGSTIIDRMLGMLCKSSRLVATSSPMMETLSGVAVALVIWYAGHQVFTGQTTQGAFTSFIGAMLMAYKPAKSLAKVNTILQRSLASVQRVYEVLDHVPSVVDSLDPIELKSKSPTIEFKNVTFAYELDGDKKALNNISFTVPAGKQVAFVGPSGGGKSTIMALMLRFYDVQGGAVEIDGHDIRDLSMASLYDHIAIVNQEATMLDNTIRHNIAYGKPDASEAEVEKAAKAAAAHEFIVEQDQGYETQVGQGGARLSGGQRQRIAIARAMLKDSPILLLDEATSALDSGAEKKVQNALKALMKGRTSMVIAHRLSTIQNADIIYVVEGGTIVEHGSHKELLDQKGAYYALCQQQHHGMIE